MKERWRQIAGDRDMEMEKIESERARENEIWRHKRAKGRKRKRASLKNKMCREQGRECERKNGDIRRSVSETQLRKKKIGG